MPIRDRLARAVADALVLLPAVRDAGAFVVPEDVHLERPARREHGDWSTNAALVLAKRVGLNPRALGAELAAALTAQSVDHVVGVEVAGPGFVNFRLDVGWLHEALGEVLEAGEDGYARPDVGHGERVQVEFISANPTGPIHVGNGWWGSYGDALARVLARSGYQVSREYYVNDTGGQIRRLGASLLARRNGTEVPEDGYRGEYVTELARAYDGPDDVTTAGRFAAERILERIKATLASVGIVFDEWYSQASIEESGAVDETIAALAAKGLVFEQDGATWFRASELGDTRDRVLRKSNGDATYLAGDLAYHRDKFLVRGFDRVIDVFGADHHGQVASLVAGVEALGVDPSRLEVKLGQMVSLVDGDETVKMGKRAGTAVALDTLVADIGPDATRLLSLMSSLDQATTFDLATAREQSMENPVFYVQYASARIAAIGRKAAERGIVRRPREEVDLAVLVHGRELELIRTLEVLPEVVAEAAVDRAPTKVTTWVRRLAGCFHGFYHDCPVLADDVDPRLAQARLWLVEGTRIGLAIGLSLLGISAPESM
ncbi:MAG: arginine--tRNA ligase [Actinomycetota bacterium]|jgi:arginyl-tRNA synthetase|nr:arginine--tRNA ligase [Actinomycetota bacterium]